MNEKTAKYFIRTQAARVASWSTYSSTGPDREKELLLSDLTVEGIKGDLNMLVNEPELADFYKSEIRRHYLVMESPMPAIVKRALKS